MSKLYISKLDAALRQLKTAINMFIRNGDPVSIHTLGCASQEILESLGKEQGIKSQTLQLLESVKPEYRKKVRNSLNKAKNFFKHADRDSTETIEFSMSANEMVLWDAALQYRELTKEVVPLLKVFVIWMHAEHPDLYIMDEHQKKARHDLLEGLDPKNKIAFFSELLPLVEDQIGKIL